MIFALVTTYGKRELTFACLVCFILAIAAFKVHPAIGILSALLLLFFIYFFRDPERSVPSDECLLLSPADGKVVEVAQSTMKDNPTQYRKISIFLAIYNVHVNRVPVSGTISKIKYVQGKFMTAMNPECADINECNWVTIKEKNSGKEIIIRQISGVAARRIVCEAKEGDSYSRGQRFGMIKLGSRMEIYVPIELVKNVNVSIGDIVKGGESVIMELNNAAKS